MTEGKAIISTGVGQHQMWAAQHYKFDEPRNWLTSGGLGSMGFGLPAAIGAQAARPDELVVDIDGDGSFVMNVQELATLHAENLPVKCFRFEQPIPRHGCPVGGSIYKANAGTPTSDRRTMTSKSPRRRRTFSRISSPSPTDSASRPSASCA